MVSKLDALKIHVLALDDDELETIIDALYDADEDELAGELFDILDDAQKSEIVTITMNVDTSDAQRRVDALRESAEAACCAVDRLGEHRKPFNGGGW